MATQAAEIENVVGAPLQNNDAIEVPVIQIPADYNPLTDAVGYCGNIDNGNGKFVAGSFQVTKIQEARLWRYFEPTGLNYWRITHGANVEYQVTCGNHITYSGWYYWEVYDHKCYDWGVNCEDEDDWEPTWNNVDLSTFNATTGTFGSFGLVLPESNILAAWNGHKVSIPTYEYTGDPALGKIARPVLLVHGLNSDYKVWGVVPALGADGKAVGRGTALFQSAQVSKYLVGSLPDMLARSQNLNNTAEGINTNGIYFYESPGAFNSAGTWIDALPHWINGDATNSQSYALYNRLTEVLNSHYGSAWQYNEQLKIDVVCHSQGGTVVREMLRGLQMDKAVFPSGTANAANHINKIVTVDSPHFGTALAGSIADAETDYPGLGVLMQDLDDVAQGSLSDRTLVSAHVDVGFLERVGKGASAGFYGLVDFSVIEPETAGAGSLVSVITVPVGIALGGALSLAGGAIAGALTDVYLKIKGPYFGPYRVEVTTDKPWPLDNSTTVDTLLGPAGFAEKLELGRQGASHLDPVNQYIKNLKGSNGSGYPIHPDGSKVTMLPLFSEDMRPLLGSILGQLANDEDKLCAEKSKEAGCFAAGDLLRSYVNKSKGYNISDIDFNDEMWTMLNNLQDHWFKESDVIVDAKSQKFVDVNSGLNPQNPDLVGYFEVPRNYVLHNSLAPWEAVAHGPFHFNKKIDALDATVAMDNDGASRQGLDLLCALSSSCDGTLGSLASAGITTSNGVLHMESAPTATVYLPVITTTNSVLQIASDAQVAVSVQNVSLTGDFNAKPLYVATGLQGVGLQNADGSFRLVAAYLPGVGSYVWYTDDQGIAHKNMIAGPEIAVQPSLARTGNMIDVTMTNYSGKTFTQSIAILLPANISVATLADQGTSMASLLPALGVAADSATQVAPQPPVSLGLAGSLVRVYHREGHSADELNTSRPRLVIQNVSDAPIIGYKVAYYFTADPKRIPMVEMDYPRDSVILENLGGDQWRFVIDMSSSVLTAGGFGPSTDGWQIRLHYADWTVWKIMDDYSANYNFGIVKANPKIVVYDLVGNILWGQVPPQYSSQTSSLIPVETAEMNWIDAVPSDQSTFKPQVTVKNTGSIALKNFHALLYFNVPEGEHLVTPPSDWYTPESQPAAREIGNGVWVLDMLFNQHILYGGESVVEGNVGLNLLNWVPFDKTILGMALVSEDGRILYGSLYSRLADENSSSSVSSSSITISSSSVASSSSNVLAVWIRNESSQTNHIKPRFRIVNSSQNSVTAFDITFHMTVEDSKQPLLDVWSAPNCETSLNNIVGEEYQVLFHCHGLNLIPGGIWPDDAGAVFGVHYSDWSYWDISNDQSLNGISTEWTASNSIPSSNVVFQ